MIRQAKNKNVSWVSAARWGRFLLHAGPAFALAFCFNHDVLCSGQITNDFTDIMVYEEIMQRLSQDIPIGFDVPGPVTSPKSLEV